jgi:ArsR family transcriptional regulator
MKTTKRQFTAEKLAKVAKILKTIAHPVKLEIMELLEAEEPLNVSTIQERLEAECELSMLSHHLTKMKDNGILTSQKRGKQVYYQLAERQILRIFDCMEKCDFL